MRKALRLVIIVLFGFASFRVAAAQETKKQEKERKKPTAAERSLKYLTEIKKHLLDSYIDGEKVDAKELVRAAASGMAAAMSDPAFENVAQETKNAIVKTLSTPKFETLEAVFAALRELEETYSFKGIKWMKLADFAATAMLKHIDDPFSHLFTLEELQKLIRMLFGQDREKSLGISLMPEDGKLIVAYVMYGYPAYVAGIEIGDEVLEIDGKPTTGMDFKTASELLQAKAGSAVSFTIRREGLLKPYTFNVQPFKDRPRDVIRGMLPGNIGYLRITIFDLLLASSVKSALKSLEKKGMRGLILDLRHNPGGALPAATSVADEFIGNKKLITYAKTRYQLDLPPGLNFLKGLIGEMPSEFRATRESRFEKLPLVVLVNKASASASELLSGALQDTGRAILIGETTYGKGVGQTAIPLWESGDGKGLFALPSRFLFLTVMRYYLPTGRSVDHIGVKPDLEIAMPKPTGEKFDTLWNLRHSGKLEEYVNTNFDKNKELFSELAEYDGFDASRYPGFTEFYQELGTSLSEDEVREELRQALRRKIETDTGKRFPYDCQADLQLQAALLEMHDMLEKEGK